MNLRDLRISDRPRRVRSSLPLFPESLSVEVGRGDELFVGNFRINRIGSIRRAYLRLISRPGDPGAGGAPSPAAPTGSARAPFLFNVGRLARRARASRPGSP